MNTYVSNYKTKLDELKVICDDNTTTVAILDAKIDEMATIENYITNEIDTGLMVQFTTILHLDSFMLVRNEMINRTLLQCYVMNLIKIKQEEYKNKTINSETNENLLIYETELMEIKQYYKENIITLIPIQNFKAKSVCAICH